VTEEVTGVDLVQWQLRIARGEPLDVEVHGHGHAVEVRLCAEDPLTFLPQGGRITELRLPTEIRVETGVAEGDEVGTGYDSLLAKLIATGETRDVALDRLAAALIETRLAGVTTNLPFLRWLVAHPALRASETTTAFLLDHPPLSAPTPAADPLWAGGFRLNLPAAASSPAPDVDAAAPIHAPGTASSELVAPMPGTVIRVAVRAGDAVAAGDPLLVLEAMKMETPLPSPYDAAVKAVHVEEGDRVERGALLVELDD